VAAQRIVLTSPWKLGLFVFMLVAGTGFGLIYAYIEVFGGEIDLRDEKVLQSVYMVLGAVAGLGLMGYIAVVTSARPLDRVVRQSRQREQLIKKFGKIQDPRMIKIEDYEEEPALKAVLERWGEQAAAASEARLSTASQNEALAQLTSQLREGDAIEFEPDLVESTPDLDALVDAIRGIVGNAASSKAVPPPAAFASSAPSTPVAPTAEAQADAPADAGWTDERSNWHAAAEKLFVCEQELEGFVRSVSEHAAEIASRTGNLSKNSGAIPREAASAVSDLRRNGMRMGKVKEASELLGEEISKLATQIDSHGGRGDDPELTGIADSLRTLASQYQRVAAEVDTSRNEQNEALDKILGMEVSTLDSSAANALAQQAMALDQHAEALSELLGRFRFPMEQIRRLAPDVADAISAPRTWMRSDAPVAEPVSDPVAERTAEPAFEPESEAESQPTPEVEPLELEPPTGDTRNFGMADPGTPQIEMGKIYEISELGGRELDSKADDASDKSKGPIYDLDEFGAVEL
jgi:hypothetical protein